MRVRSQNKEKERKASSFKTAACCFVFLPGVEGHHQAAAGAGSAAVTPPVPLENKKFGEKLEALKKRRGYFGRVCRRGLPLVAETCGCNPKSRMQGKHYHAPCQALLGSWYIVTVAK